MKQEFPHPLAALPPNVVTLTDDIAQMERILTLLAREADLRRQLDAAGVAWARRPRSRKEIAEFVAARWDLTVTDIVGPRTLRWLAHARDEAVYLMRAEMLPNGQHAHSSPEIGRYLGDRDHTSVLAAEQRHRRRLEQAKLGLVA